MPLHVHFGPFIFSFICAKDCINSFLRSHFATHLTEKKPDCTITIAVEAGRPACPAALGDRYTHETDGETFNFGPDIICGRWERRSRSFSLTAREYIFSTDNIWLFDRLLCRIFFTVVSENTQRDSASVCIMHSAGVAADGKAFLFFGGPGSGKSTIAGFSEHHTVLHDDMNLIMLHGDSPTVEGMPFNPKLIKKRRLRAPLTALFSLHKSRKVSIERGIPQELSERLLPEMYLPLSAVSNDKQKAYSHLFQAVEKFSAIPYYRLYFKKDDSFWLSILQTAGKG